MVVITERADPVTLHAIDREKPSAVVWKDAEFKSHLQAAVLAVAVGGRHFPPVVTDALMAGRRAPDAFFKILSEVEQEIMWLVGAAASTEEIASTLRCTPGTIRSHLSHIRKKVGVGETRADLMRWAWKEGFLPEHWEAGGPREPIPLRVKRVVSTGC